MLKFKRHPHPSRGQALVEFAIIAVVLLMVIFLIIEAARIMWAWGTVQNAARTGARYAVTGQADRPDCSVEELSKFNYICGEDSPDLRLASVISRTHAGLAGLPLNEDSGIFEDPNYYNIEVWGGVQGTGELRPNFAGMPNEAVVVRAYYRVPIITPFFSSILPSIPVFGQAMMNNESFGQLGGSSEGIGIPAAVVIPTAGVTPSPTNSPTPTPTEAITSTPTQRATNTATATPDICQVKFDSPAVAGYNFVLVTGEIGSNVRIINLSTGEIISGYQQLSDFDGHACPGFATVFLNITLQAGMGLVVESSDGSSDITFVLPGTATATASPTASITPTPPPVQMTSTPTPTPTNTPTTPYIYLRPSCGSPDPVTGIVQFTLFGANWPVGQDVVLYWQNTSNFQTRITGHNGFFTQTWTKTGLANGTYNVIAISGSTNYTTQYKVPCDNATAVPTAAASPTTTPQPADMIIVGPPEMVSTGTPVAYQPITYQMIISNTGDVNVQNQFFVDLFIDPVATIQPNSLRIPIGESSGYVGVSSLPGNSSRVITITSDFGFANEPTPHFVYGMVDSIEQIGEAIETNNISTPDVVDYVQIADTPTPTPSYGSGSQSLMGFVQWPSDDGLDPLLRARVTLYDQITGQFVARVEASPISGFYRFDNLPTGSYRIEACGGIDQQASYFGMRVGIDVPNVLPLVSVFTNHIPCP
ncbi:MAG: pilus assembly protein [Anaerolineales bacterium]|nr:pilus assembly protein [Anaerolineales bacterium]